jgi:starvation-inducible DNA-binding protein
MHGSPVVSCLTSLLSNTFALAAKTHGSHWNLTGPYFFSLHKAFEDQYAELYEAADDVAERIRALGATAPAGLQALASGSTLPPSISATDGISLAKALLADHRLLANACREAIPVAQANSDEPTADLLITRAAKHEKTAWMLAAAIA